MKLKQTDYQIGQNIKRLRLRSGFSQSQIVLKLQLLGLNISYDIYKKIEQNKYNIDIALLVALHSIYHISYDEFFTGLDISMESVQKE